MSLIIGLQLTFLYCRKPSIKIRIATKLSSSVKIISLYCRKPSIKIRIATDPQTAEKLHNTLLQKTIY